MTPARRFTLLALTLAVLAAGPAVRAQEPARAAPAYRHAYYLFLSDTPVMCEACYVPLLITVDPLEEIAKQPEGAACVLITTYERDSIWQINGMVQVKRADIEAAPRTIRVRNRNYRYQEITAAEVLRLFEKPMGTIPISRPLLHSDLPPGPSLEALKAAFRDVK